MSQIVDETCRQTKAEKKNIVNAHMYIEKKKIPVKKKNYGFLSLCLDNVSTYIDRLGGDIF